MKIKGVITTTATAVVFFLIVLVFALDAEAKEKEGFIPYLELGTTVVHSTVRVGGAGVVLYKKWDVHVGVMGEGDTRKHGYQAQKVFYSFSRIVHPNWRVLGGELRPRIGIAYTPDFQLVGRRNYRLGLILHYSVFELEYFHYSSAGINDNNRGVDGLAVRALF